LLRNSTRARQKTVVGSEAAVEFLVANACSGAGDAAAALGPAGDHSDGFGAAARLPKGSSRLWLVGLQGLQDWADAWVH
jgi:hypothetical protein